MIVLDASAGLSIAQNSQTGRSLRLLIGKDEVIIAPEFFMLEVTNASWKYVHAGVYDTERAKTLMHNTLALVNCYVPASDLMDEVFAEACHLNHSVYDITYIVLARRHAATLMTCDAKMQDMCAKAGVNCVEHADLNECS